LVRHTRDAECGDIPVKRRDARVTVGLPVYNGEQFLAVAIESVLAQTYGDLRLVISDNASTDRTEGICRDFAARDARVDYHRAELNRGIVWNFNQVFRLSTTEYFMWFAHDDALTPTYVQRCVEVLDADAETVLCFSGCVDIDAHGRVLGTRRSTVVMSSPDPVARFREAIRLDHLCEPWCGVTRADVLRRTPLLGSYADYDRVIIAELGLHGRFVEIPDALFVNREHEQRSHQVHASRFERTRWLDPRNAHAIVYPHFRQMRAFWGAVRRSGLRSSDRMRCGLELARWAKTYRRRLVSDVEVATREVARAAVRCARVPH
jgi:glycosyltransferase involved in cell wall biosynthesis